MAKTDLSDLGSRVCVGDDHDEKFVPALGNNSAVPGDLCSIDPSTGRVRGSDIDGDFDAGENFVGILKESKITGPDAAVATDEPCSLVKPKSGHDYRIHCVALPAGGEDVGTGGTFSTTAYKADFEDVALIDIKLGSLSLEGYQADEIVEVTWK